jgi:hypothetical protein
LCKTTSHKSASQSGMVEVCVLPGKCLLSSLCVLPRPHCISLIVLSMCAFFSSTVFPVSSRIFYDILDVSSAELFVYRAEGGEKHSQTTLPRRCSSPQGDLFLPRQPKKCIISTHRRTSDPLMLPPSSSLTIGQP